MKKLLTNNWMLKLFAVLAAGLLWLVVVNENEPIISYPILNVPVTLVNDDIFAENNMVYWVTEGTTVNIQVEARQTVVKQLRASDFQLTADCLNWHPGFPTIPIEVEIVNNRTLYQNGYTLSNTSIKVEAEELATKTLDVEVNPVGDPADGYTLGSVVCSPSQIEVTAPKSLSQILTKAVVNVRVKDETSNVEDECAIQILDGNNDIKNVGDAKITLSHETVKVSAEILKTKSVPVIVTNVTGQPAEGYRYTEAICSIASVTIAGPKAAISNITGIILDSDLLDVTGASANVKVSLDLTEYLPDNVTLEGMESNIAEVEMVVEPLAEKQFDIRPEDVEILNREENLGYSLGDEPISITVLGLSEDLESLDYETLRPAVDAAGLGLGQHPVTIQLEIGDIYQLRETAEATLEITDAQETESDGE